MNLPSHADRFCVLFVGDTASSQPEFGHLELAARFYGFPVVTIAAESLRLSAAGEQSPILVALHVSAFDRITAAQAAAVHAFAKSSGVPLALLGLSGASGPAALAKFTDHAKIGTRDIPADCGLWVIADGPASTGYELRNLRLNMRPGGASALECSGEGMTVLAAVGPTQVDSKPALVRLSRNGGSIYLLSRTAPATSTESARPGDRSLFGELATIFLMLREVGGKRGWHPPARVGNLTIDDPYLVEPYGCLAYAGLLEEMKRERFHTTIGFVPWNFDRNSSEVVRLFRSNPEQFSIAIHGNNHDRYEFYRYQAQPGDNQRPKTLAEQEYNIRQALRRMEVFREQTGIEYDRVMVFPHGVCPAATFELLSRYGFWATSNYSNVPLGEPPPADGVLALRGANDHWYGLPALRRCYPQHYSEELTAVDLFLGNPVLFMAHQDLFFDGIDAFSAAARRVNQRQPNLEWKSLGDISRQLYLTRWLSDSHCDVRLLSRQVTVRNTGDKPVLFTFTKREPTSKPAKVQVDGTDTDSSYDGDTLRFAATLPPNTTASIQVRHAEADFSSVELGRRGFRNHVLRTVADIRDLALSRIAIGRVLTQKYYRHGKRRPTVSSLVKRSFQWMRSADSSGKRMS